MADSIVVKAVDQASKTLKDIGNSGKALSKEFEEMKAKADALRVKNAALNKEFSNLSATAVDAQKAIKSANKAYKESGSEADKLNLDNAINEYKRLTDSISEVKNASKSTRKEVDALEGKLSGSSGSGSGGMGDGGLLGSGLTKRLSDAGLYKMLGDSASQLIGTFFESAVGQPMAMLGSSLASGVANGAAMGAMVGNPMIGAALGAVSGLATGGAQVFQATDEAFKTYYNGIYEAVSTATADGITSGSTIAAQREKDKISFTTLFGSEEVATDYLSGLVDMANRTPFLYDDLTAMSKTLATYGYGADAILPTLQKIGDAGAALGMGTSDMTMVATALGRMKSSNKTTLEYLNILNDRGIGAVGMLADAKGVSVGEMYSMISKGKIAGGEASEIILNALADKYDGSMQLQSQTFEGLSSTLTGLQQEIENASGDGYNAERSPGIQDEIDAYGGALGEALQAVGTISGENQAYLENLSDQYKREALSAVLLGEGTTLYDGESKDALTELRTAFLSAKEAYANGDETAGLKIEALKENAEALGTLAYESSDAYKLMNDTERDQIEAIRENTAALGNWKENYLTQQEQSKGRGIVSDGSLGSHWREETGQYAYGLDYVPYDNFPAVLHQGEAVLTAAEARGRGSGEVVITGNSFTVREEADIGRIATALAEQIEAAAFAAVPCR